MRARKKERWVNEKNIWTSKKRKQNTKEKTIKKNLEIRIYRRNKGAEITYTVRKHQTANSIGKSVIVRGAILICRISTPFFLFCAPLKHFVSQEDNQSEKKAWKLCQWIQHLSDRAIICKFASPMPEDDRLIHSCDLADDWRQANSNAVLRSIYHHRLVIYENSV